VVKDLYYIFTEKHIIINLLLLNIYYMYMPALNYFAQTGLAG